MKTFNKTLLNLAFWMVLIASSPLAFAQDTDVSEDVVQDPKAQEKIKNLRIAYLSEKLGLPRIFRAQKGNSAKICGCPQRN
jgi:hypothetical protein